MSDKNPIIDNTVPRIRVCELLFVDFDQVNNTLDQVNNLVSSVDCLFRINTSRKLRMRFSLLPLDLKEQSPIQNCSLNQYLHFENLFTSLLYIISLYNLIFFSLCDKINSHLLSVIIVINLLFQQFQIQVDIFCGVFNFI